MALQLLVVFGSGFFAMKLFDLLVVSIDRPGPLAFLTFLTNPCLLVYRRRNAEPTVSSVENLRRSIRDAIQLGVGLALLEGFWVIDFGALGYWQEHSVKSLGFFLCLLGLFGLIAAVWRSFGAIAREPHVGAMFPTTPAEFWRSYNRIVHQFLLEDVFKKAGGPRSPFLGVMLAFLVSGLLHEYLFSLLAGRAQGLQTAFFLIQGLAVAMTVRVRATGWRRSAWVAATLAFNIATATLFLASFHEVFPLYVNELPAWLGPLQVPAG
jgi:hypothetical protein